ncbi:cation transporter [Vibrio sp. UCD-FRSSP16_10]|uniref:cation transporter n=1 Tax=unclassified Vibrio TaxID=2614977 RepID=UPI0008019C7D|nr:MULTISPECIES: cation transporter [unclassified Vibrio]OBT09450.1 cation transporter [Vibrio sp. UCD-FRSSP16_30]OBT22129.1 cation transporter [Vibrio sp. UCD-FRSSP16_10]
MNKDSFGICITSAMLKKNERTTFTHVRAYQAGDSGLDLRVLLAIPQITGKELLNTIQHSRELIWRATYQCTREYE